MNIVIPKELNPLEARVAASPASVKKLIELGFSVTVETQAGAAASFTDDEYQRAGASSVAEACELYRQADIVLKVLSPTEAELSMLRSGSVLICFIWPAQNAVFLKKLADKDITTLAVDAVPRLSRAQSMDVLSSMANIAGYRAVMEAAHCFGRFFTGQITAAGKIPPAKVLIIGAGVAGLAAIGTAKSLGAIVRAFDTRPAVREQVESMGGEFLHIDIVEDGSGSGGYAREMSKAFIDAEMALFREQAKEIDIVITTALIPGQPAPKLWLNDMVQSMKNGSIVVDLAAELGGNCEATVPGEKIVRHGVTIIGYTNLPSRAASQASILYGTNLVHLLKLLCPTRDGEIQFDFSDEVIRGVTVIKDAKVCWPPPQSKTTVQDGGQKKAAQQDVTITKSLKEKKAARLQNPWILTAVWFLAGLSLLALGEIAPAKFVEHLTVFVLSVIVGFHVIWNVSHALHTPLMSVTNAISGIVIIGALLQISGSGSMLVATLAFIAVLVSSINIGGGFYVTQRMLKMFRK